MLYDEPDPAAPEVPLLGGDVTEGLVRKGSTVRRPHADTSAAIEQLLGALEHAGYDGAPRHLGVDSAGRDVLDFVHGEVAGRPWPAWVGDPDRAVSVARLVRRYDDAAEQLGVPAWAWALTKADPAGCPPSIAPDPTLIAHLDVTPDNVVFRAGSAAALIDFDLARPASRVEELANVLLWWAPWAPEADRNEVFAGVDPFARGRAIVDAYGLGAQDRARVVDVSRNIADRSWFAMRHRADTLGGGWARMWREGVGDVILRRQAWLAANAAQLDDAVR